MNNKLIDKIIDRLFGDDEAQQSTIDATTKNDLGRCILVMNQGWVLVADVIQQGTRYLCENVSVVRRWGTDAGLGQLAREGKLTDTKLDAQPDTIVFEHTIQQIITNSKL